MPYDKKWYEANREDVIAKKRKWNADNKDKRRNYYLKKLYGISLEEYDAKLVAQDFRCYVCNKHHTETTKGLYVDHNHTTGDIRKLLCSECNSLIGMCKEDIEILKKAILYLEEHN